MWVLLPTDFVSNLDRKCSKVKSRNRIGQPSKGAHHFVVMNTALFKLLVSTFGVSSLHASRQHGTNHATETGPPRESTSTGRRVF